MSALRFCFVLHIHQPVGNFDHVFREHADDVYRPFFDYLDDRELWPIGLHVSGPLLEWLGENDPALHDRIGRMASDGRAELLAAGWYEPVLAALSREDRATQLGWTRDEMERRFGVAPTGLWLTERVWEPDLPRDLADAGIEYVLIDDHLARKAGVCESALRRPLRTEAGGRPLDLLAIDEQLRYLIPFRPADEIETELRRRQAAGDVLALMGDDGEKFGGWPRTKEWLYAGGWLRAFADRMDALRREDVVRLVAPGTARDEIEARGPVYLPSGSYPELEEWALGGHWKGFLARYEEANRMHKRVVALSAECRRRGDPADVRRAIGRAQCNDAYWHGVFGGLYMKHLREGVRREMSRAERSLRVGQPLTCEEADHDFDGRADWWVHGEVVSAWVDRRYGGTVTELTWLEGGFDVCDVLTRRREAYHDEALARATGGERPEDPGQPPAGPGRGGEIDDTRSEDRAGDGGASASGSGSESIHDIEASAVLDRLPPVDREPRALVRDRVLAGDTELVDYEAGIFEPVWAAGEGSLVDPEGAPIQGLGASGPNTAAGPERGGALTWCFVPAEGPRVRKSLTLTEEGYVIVEWTWAPTDFPAGSRFAPELSLGAPVTMELEPRTDTWRYPIVTVSKCPDGFEEIEQGESITPLWPVELGRASLRIGPPLQDAPSGRSG